MTTARKFSAVLLDGKASDAEVFVPASLLLCWTRTIPPAGGVTVKFRPLLVWPPTVTTTGPLVAPPGTGATRLVALQFPGPIVAAIPLNVTVLVPCDVPKLVPAIVTASPTAPDAGLRVVKVGGGTVTVKVSE